MMLPHGLDVSLGTKANKGTCFIHSDF